MALVKYNNNSISSVTSAASFPAGAMTLIKTITASSDSTISLVDGSSDVVLDSTYPIYMFKFINMHPATDNVNFLVNFRDGSTNYDATKTTSFFAAYHGEDDSGPTLEYLTGLDLAQSTSSQPVGYQIGNDNDASLSGEIYLFNPSSTTFVKHFIVRTHNYHKDNYVWSTHAAGYCNVTLAIDAVQFSMSSGNIDSGTIKLYGIKDS